MIDLHSDTVTKPTNEMRERMMSAEVGDDVSYEDPTVKILERRVATMFHKEAALFFPSGTMSNLTAVLTWCPQRGSEIIVGDNSHMFLFEQGGSAQFGGISTRSIKNLSDGTMDINDINFAIREDDIHEPITKLICIENTHNACGGKVLPDSFLNELSILASSHKIPIHMDGARIWNALTASGKSPYEISKYVDSLSVCLSKGLGCPIGSLLVGSKEFIEKARRIRKGLGGGMRQVGIIAASGLVGLDDFEKGILKHDHIRLKRIVEEIGNLQAFQLMTPIIETNILFLEIKNGNSLEVQELFKSYGIIISAWSHKRIRIVIHRDIDDNMIQHTINTFKEISDLLINKYQL
jgi:threonine aldolase